MAAQIYRVRTVSGDEFDAQLDMQDVYAALNEAGSGANRVWMVLGSGTVVDLLKVESFKPTTG